MKLYQHQKETVKFLSNTPQAFDTSTCGTGKTISTLETWHRRKDGKMLVIAPKSTLEAVWGNDVAQFYPGTKCGVFNRKYTKQINYIPRLLTENDIVVINIEATNLILKNLELIKDEYKTLVVDEFTSIKNRTAQRSKAVGKLASWFPYRYLLSGTPTPNGLLDIWHPCYLLDGGQRLGANYFAFRNAICQPVTKGHFQQFTTWEEIPGASDVVADSLRDITIRYVLEDVVDMPKRIYRTLDITMPDKLRKHYAKMLATSILELKNKDITAVNKAVLGNKLLQICSGTMYDNDGQGVNLDTYKYELITELVKEREHSLVVFMWKHQRQAMEKELMREKITYAVIDGSVKASQRAQIVADYQAGQYQTLLIQPQAAAHGITLTRSTATIWCSPTWNLEHFIQMNHRDYRIGQKKRSEVLMVAYKDSIENRVYESLQAKKTSLDNLLEILQS